MKNLFNPTDTKEILDRIEKLTPQSQRQWGKMEVAQMLDHITRPLETAIGIRKPKRAFIGILLGRFVKDSYYNEKPFPKNSPTDPTFIVTGSPDFDVQKQKVIGLVKQFSEGGEAKCTTHPHPFFGTLTAADWARSQYKHLDHHFRQFGV